MVVIKGWWRDDKIRCVARRIKRGHQRLYLLHKQDWTRKNGVKKREDEREWKRESLLTFVMN